MNESTRRLLGEQLDWMVKQLADGREQLKTLEQRTTAQRAAVDRLHQEIADVRSDLATTGVLR